MEAFEREYFDVGGEGAYLEQCCGKGNVHLNVVKNPFLAVQTIMGTSVDKVEIEEIFERYNTMELWDMSIYKRSMLMSYDEIKKAALSPFRHVMVRNFGEVNEKNFQEFSDSFSVPSQGGITAKYYSTAM